jgi:hypothetical protein
LLAEATFGGFLGALGSQLVQRRLGVLGLLLVLSVRVRLMEEEGVEGGR